MSRFQMIRQEQGVRYTTLEIESATKEEAMEFMVEDGTVVSQHFKQHDADILSFTEVP